MDGWMEERGSLRPLEHTTPLAQRRNEEFLPGV